MRGDTPQHGQFILRGCCMGTHTVVHHSTTYMAPAVRKVNRDSPWFWLAAGWSDFVRVPGISLLVGSIVTASMILVVSLLRPSSYPFLAAGVFATVVFLGPVLAVGLYEVSRRIEHRKPVGLMQLYVGWLRNAGGVLTAGGVLLLFMFTWYLISIVSGTLLFGMDTTVQAATRMDSVGMWFVFSAVALPILVKAFALMVISVPMLIDRQGIDIVTAMYASLQAVRANLGVMLLWAMLIVLFTALAIAPIFLGLTVVFPLLAYASWHAYRDLVVR